MRSALLLCASLAGSAQAQRLTATEAGVGAAALAARRDFFGAELGLARRPGGQARLALGAAGGSSEGRAGVRLEAGAQFLVNPAARSGASLYGGLGVAFLGARGARGAGYLTLVLGVESAAGRASGWYGELGLGGGLRVAAGRRWRRFPAWWRT